MISGRTMRSMSDRIAGTYVKIGTEWKYLNRAVKSAGPKSSASCSPLAPGLANTTISDVRLWCK